MWRAHTSHPHTIHHHTSHPHLISYSFQTRHGIDDTGTEEEMLVINHTH